MHKYGPGKLPPSPDNKKIIGVICPHAGYEYSGPIAANSYYAISSQRPELVIIVGPNHWGIGRDIATMKEGVWRTPLGDIEVDAENSMEINKICKLIEMDYFFSYKRSLFRSTTSNASRDIFLQIQDLTFNFNRPKL